MNANLLFFFLLVALAICIIIMAVAAWDKKFGTVIGSGFATMFFLILIIAGSAYTIGYGNVTLETEGLKTRLKTGVAYQLVSSVKDGTDQVILVKKAGTSDFYALRVKEIPPEHFTLIDGEPVTIVQSAPPVAVK